MVSGPFTGEKSFFNKWYWENSIYMQKNEVVPFYTINKSNSKWITDLNLRAKI